MSKFETAVDTMIRYRWNTNKLFIRWNEVAEVVYSETGLWFNKDTQLHIRKQKTYRERVFGFLANGERVLDISWRAEQYNKTQLEYIAYLFGIKPKDVVSFCRLFNLDLPTTFKYDDSIRKESEIRKQDPKRGKGDCVVRAIAMALQIPYDEVLTDLETLQGEDPTKGTQDWYWQPYVYKRGWKEVEVKPWKKVSLHKLIDSIPELGHIPMLVCVSRHLFFMNSTTVNIDTWDAAYRDVRKILVRKEDYNYATNLIGGELSIQGMIHKLLECRKNDPNVTWKKVYEKIGIRWFEGQAIRRSVEFHKYVENTDDTKWAIHKEE